jgi:hypothetical protein
MLDGAYNVRCICLQIQEVRWKINDPHSNLKSRTGEDKGVAAVIKVGTVWATRGDRDAEINTVREQRTEREPRERVCRSWCRQTSLLPTIQEDRCCHSRVNGKASERKHSKYAGHSTGPSAGAWMPYSIQGERHAGYLK